MLFKLKKRCGDHYQNGKRYRAGDIVESSLDLCVRFPAKFERDFAAEQKANTAPAVSKPNIPPPVDKGGDKNKPSPLSTKYGEDVTSKFPTAEEVEVLVFEKSKWYTVVDKADGEVLNEKKLRRKDVEPFLGQYLSDEDENTDED